MASECSADPSNGTGCSDAVKRDDDCSPVNLNCSSSSFSETELIMTGELGAFVPGPLNHWMIVVLSVYALICTAGTIGNALVVYVIIRFAKMKSITNIYLLNLAISDFCFLLGLPFLIVTAVQQQWIFGPIMCKIFYVLTAINWFTSIFTLTVLSADRYLAVCHAVQSMHYRTPAAANAVCLGVWVVSFVVMTPIFMYGRTVDDSGRSSCTIEWPDGQLVDPDHAFVWYSFSLGFAVPVLLISVFYGLVVIRLRKVGPNQHNTNKKKRCHRRVTHMVLAVIAVYVVCWLPYWIYQTTLLFVDLPDWTKLLFQLVTVFSYANSALNPFLYAFLSESFRSSFCLAFRCQDDHHAGTALASIRLLAKQTFMFPGRKSTMTAAAVTMGTMASAAMPTSAFPSCQNNTLGSGSKAMMVRLKINGEEVTRVSTTVARQLPIIELDDQLMCDRSRDRDFRSFIASLDDTTAL